MDARFYKRYLYYLKSVGGCIVVVGGCWLFYQVRETSRILGSAVTTNVLNLEQAQARYIYIDDPRYKEIFMFRNDNDLQSSASERPKGLTRVIAKWWKSLHRSVALKLLHMAKNGSREERHKAVCTLCSLKHLKDWHYCQMAQMLDAKTAVALARTPGVDLRFFMKPPYYHVRHKLYELIEYVHYLMMKLDGMCENRHPCLVQFLKTKFRDSQREGGVVFDHDLANVGLAVTPAIVWNQQLLRNCIEAIHHHSSLEQYAKDIVDAGALPILMDVQKILANDIQVCIFLAKIISNLSLHKDCLEDLFESGWIGILAGWSKSADVRLSAPAVRALANLDFDYNPTEKYHPRIYLLHPQHRLRGTPKLDVVFIHGLLGGVFVTWRQRDLDASSIGLVESPDAYFSTDTLNAVIGEHPQEFLKDLARDLKTYEWKRVGHDCEVVLQDCPENMNSTATGPFTCTGDAKCMEQAGYDRIHRTQCWPRDWLPKDVSSLRVLGINYDTNLSMWNTPCPLESLSTINERSVEFIRKLSLSGVGKRPVIWVCHSMGGLLVKKMLVEEWKNGDKNGLCGNTKAIIFYSTPHRGSHVAALKQPTQMVLWPSVEVQELRQESPALLKLHADFLTMLKNYTIDIVSFSETKSTLVTALRFPLQFVTPYSADPGVGEFFEIPQDHLSICKPGSRQSFLYRKVLSIVRRHVPVENSTWENGELLLTKLLSWPKRVS